MKLLLSHETDRISRMPTQFQFSKSKLPTSHQPGETHCDKRQFVFSTMASLHLDSQSGRDSSICSCNRTRADLMLIVFIPWLHQPGVTPVPSSFPDGRFRTWVQSWETSLPGRTNRVKTTVPSDSLFFVPWRPCKLNSSFYHPLAYPHWEIRVPDHPKPTADKLAIQLITNTVSFVIKRRSLKSLDPFPSACNT